MRTVPLTEAEPERDFTVAGVTKDVAADDASARTETRARALRVAAGARRDAGVPTKAEVHAMLAAEACECGSRDSV